MIKQQGQPVPQYPYHFVLIIELIQVKVLSYRLVKGPRNNGYDHRNLNFFYLVIVYCIILLFTICIDVCMVIMVICDCKFHMIE